MRTVRPRRFGIRGPATVLLAAATVVALAACGADTDPGSGSGSTPSVTTPTGSPGESPSDDPSGSASPTDDPMETESPLPEKVRIKVKDGTVTGAPDRLPVAIGQTVLIVITSDVADEVHVHGIEETLLVSPGVKHTLELVVPADPGPGLYDVELHSSGLLLFQLEVR